MLAGKQDNYNILYEFQVGHIPDCSQSKLSLSDLKIGYALDLFVSRLNITSQQYFSNVWTEPMLSGFNKKTVGS